MTSCKADRVSRYGWSLQAVSKLALVTIVGALPCTALSVEHTIDDWTDVPIENLLTTKVYSASRFVQNASDAPSAVTVLTAADIKTFGWRTLAEALRSLPGLHTSYDRNYSYLGARGFLRSGDFNPRFLLLIDGNRANDPIYDQAMLGSESVIDIDLVDRIEYVPGPGSSVYGSNAFFGVINVITKRGRDINGWQVSGEAGSQNAQKGRISHGWRDENGHELLLSATAYHREGKNQFYPEFVSATSDGIALNLDYDRGRSFFLKGAAGPFNLSLAYSDRTKGTPTASYEQEFNARGSKIVDEQMLSSISYQRSLSPTTELSANLFFNHYNFLGNYIYSSASPPPSLVTNHDSGNANWWGGGLKLVSSHFDRHKLVAGIDYQKSDPIEQENHDVAPYLSKLNIENQNSREGVYLQDEWQALDNLILSMGLRYDHNSAADENHVNPRLGVIYRLSPATTVKALYGRAYRLPNAYELYYAIPGDGGQKTNPELRAERIRSYEMVLEHLFAANSRIRLSVYRNKVTDLITMVQDPADDLYVFRNINKATARGFEAALEQGWNNGTRLRTSASWQRATDDETGAILENSPHYLGKLNLSVPFYNNLWRAGFETVYVAARDTLNSRTGGYVLNNLTLFSDRLARNVEFSASIYNLLDKRYSDPVGKELVQESISQDGRSLRVKLTYSF